MTAAMPRTPAAIAKPVSTGLAAPPGARAGLPLPFLPAATGAGLGPALGAGGAAAKEGFPATAGAEALGAEGGLGGGGAADAGLGGADAPAGGAPPGGLAPAGMEGSLMVAEEGLGGRLMRTVSFFG